jgi:ectoine hydroxylase-related dioxygenase (phytanoyl-CoA dioxygenase family)
MIENIHSDAVQRRTLDPVERAHYRQHGWVVLRGLLAASTVADLAADVHAVLRARNMADSYLAQSSEFLADSPIHRLVASPALQALAGGIMDGQAHLYMGFTAVKGPGQGAFTFHQDGQYTPFAGPGLNCWFALVDCTPANGGLRMVSGTHRDGYAGWKASETCPGHRTLLEQPTSWDDVRMQAGDCCVFDRATVHGSGPNHSADPRLAYAVQFHRSDTTAFFDDAWELLVKRPRWRTTPVAAFSDAAERGE